MTTPTSLQDRPLADTEPDLREIARRRVEAKRKFRSDLVAYVVINAFLVLAWAVDGGGSFWPGWVLAGWGAFLLIDAYRVYLSGPITDADIDKEMRAQR